MLDRSESWQHASMKLSSLLFQTTEVSPLVLNRIFTCEKLQQKLITEIRTETDLLQLFEDIKQELRSETIQSGAPMDSPSELVKNGISEFWKWMGNYFNVVSSDREKERIEICRSCPYLEMEGKGSLYKIGESLLGHSPICIKCGCMVNKKAKIASSTCPMEHPQQHGYSLWGDPL